LFPWDLSRHTTADPTSSPTAAPTTSPTAVPTAVPSPAPSDVTSDLPSDLPSDVPSAVPSDMPSYVPSDFPSLMPSGTPSGILGVVVVGGGTKVAGGADGAAAGGGAIFGAWAWAIPGAAALLVAGVFVGDRRRKRRAATTSSAHALYATDAMIRSPYNVIGTGDAVGSYHEGLCHHMPGTHQNYLSTHCALCLETRRAYYNQMADDGGLETILEGEEYREYITSAGSKTGGVRLVGSDEGQSGHNQYTTESGERFVDMDGSQSRYYTTTEGSRSGVRLANGQESSYYTTEGGEGGYYKYSREGKGFNGAGLAAGAAGLGAAGLATAAGARYLRGKNGEHRSYRSGGDGETEYYQYTTESGGSRSASRVHGGQSGYYTTDASGLGARFAGSDVHRCQSVSCDRCTKNTKGTTFLLSTWGDVEPEVEVTEHVVSCTSSMLEDDYLFEEEEV